MSTSISSEFDGPDVAVWLDQPATALVRDPAPLAVRIDNIFRRESITSVRDLLVIGSVELVKIRGVAETVSERISDAINDNPHHIALLKRPTVSDISRVADTLSQVPGIAVNGRDYTGEVDQYTLVRNARFMGRMTMQDLIDASPNEIDSSLRKHEKSPAPEARRVKATAAWFEDAFNKCKTDALADNLTTLERSPEAYLVGIL